MRMNHMQPESKKSDGSENDEPSRGPNLVLMYSLIALAILLAFGCAAMIVLPFYLRR